jgi:hypothetical protein
VEGDLIEVIAMGLNKASVKFEEHFANMEEVPHGLVSVSCEASCQNEFQWKDEKKKASSQKSHNNQFSNGAMKILMQNFLESLEELAADNTLYCQGKAQVLCIRS